MSSLLILSLSLLVNSITVHYQPTNKIIDPFPTLVPPPLPTPIPPSTFSVSIVNEPDPSIGLSIPQSGAFFGLSIEFSATSQLIGKNGTVIHVPFLNLLSNIAQRAGHVNVRIGGSSIDHSTLVSDLEPENSAILYADLPPLGFTTDFIYMLANISSLVPTKWYLGIPFGESTTHHDLAMAEYSQAILGDNLAGLLVGHQPDLYSLTGRRPYNYSPSDYSLEFGQLAAAMQDTTPIDDSSAVSSNNAHNKASTLLIGPNIISGASGWTPEQVWYTGFVDVHKNNLAALSVQHYATTTCHPTTNTFPSFLNHTSATALVTPYLSTSRIAQSAHKPLLMSETNPTAESCPDGLPGITDSFGASLWALDYALQLAYANFSGAMFHNSPGHNASSNAFRAPPPIQGSTQGWTIGPIYYSALVMAEILDPSGSSRVLDLGTTNDEISIFTPVYAVYEDDGGGPSPRATKVALFNYLSGESGTIWVDLKLGVEGGTTPGTVWVKTLLADSVSQKEGITWAGQTFGGFFESDGVPRGSIHIESVSCTTTCRIRVPAPGFALVFLTIDAIEEHLDISDAESEFEQILTGSAGGTTHTLAVAEGEGAMMKTFGTTVRTEAVGPVTVTVDPAVVATSNGERRRAALGRTAPRWRSGTVKINDARRGVRAGDWMWLVGFVLGVLCSWAS